jgi:hypothetical protein
MKRRVLSILYLVAGLSALVSCSRSSGPPAPLAADEIPAAFAKEFLKADAPIKELSTQVTAALQNKDYPAAYAAVQSLCSAPGLSKAQQLLSARASLSITALLQSASAQGDKGASSALKNYQMNR